MSDHAFLAPSSAFRWVNCAQAPSLEARYPETEESPHALEGTAAHWVVEGALLGKPYLLVGDQTYNGVAVTQEMLEGAELVHDDVRQQIGLNWSERLFIEQKVQIARVHSQNWGTPDYYAWGQLPDGRLKLTVWDYKFGFGIVEAFENWQLIDYVAGLVGEAKLDGLQEQNCVVDMRVIQPRAPHRDGPVRSWMVKASDLRAYWNRLEMAAEDATSVKPTASPTPDGCKNCLGRGHCEALQRAAARAADHGEHYLPLDLSPHALGLELRNLKQAQALLEARVSGLEAEAAGRIKQGERVPFWALDSAPGRLAWTKTVPEVMALGQMLGLDLAKPTDVITPAQAKAAAKARKLPAELFDAYATRPAGAVKLIFDDGAKARLTFASSVA